MEYFEVLVPDGDGLCSDNNCPCTTTVIPQGKGYLYISSYVVEFRSDARSVEEMYQKIEKRQAKGNRILTYDQEILTAILTCEVGATNRDLDLETAASDASYWWETGLVPLRATPKNKSKWKFWK